MGLSTTKGKLLSALAITWLILPQIAAPGTFRPQSINSAEGDTAQGATLLTFRKPAAEELDAAPLAAVAAAPVPAEANPQIDDISSTDQFPIDPALQKRVKFWVRVYTKLSTSEGVLHDAKYVDVIYKRLDFSDLSDFTISALEREKTITKRIKAEKKALEDVLKGIHAKQHNPSALTGEESRIAQLLKDVNEPDKYKAAAHRKRLRFQLGQRDRFLQGLYYSGRYLPTMERIFKAKGMPMELTRLPFVESSFNLKARSKVGASGIWQFMRSTGKIFMRIDDTVDERNDPIRATAAATDLLQGNYAALGSWPLALTAYNHGRLGMVRAVQAVKSNNIVDIIEHYKSSSFGFASSNFYAEFVAAKEIATHADRYFEHAEIDRLVEFAEFVMTDYIDLKDLSTYSRIPLDVLQDLNPGLSDQVLQSMRLVPAGYVLRIPPEERDRFLARYGEIPGYRKFSAQKITPQRYIAEESRARRQKGRKRR